MEEGTLYDVVIIGAGPAGLTAAIYTGRALLSTLVLEKTVPGGQLNETDFIENYPGFEEKVAAPELTGQMRKQAERLGAQIAIEEAAGIEPIDSYYRIKGTKNTFETRAVIIASGSRPRELPVEGAHRLKGRGISYCATCDGYFFQGKHVLEVGAGDSGFEEALFLTKFVQSVGIVVRHPEDDPHALRASPILQKRVKENPKITFLWNLDGTVDLNKDRFIVTDDRLCTNLPGVFAAGDVRVVSSRYAQAVVAAGDGAIAAIEAEKYLADQFFQKPSTTDTNRRVYKGGNHVSDDQ